MTIPFVSIIIPCRNEEKFIRQCLDSILNQDYPKDKMEVLVIDGMSEDKTRNIIQTYAAEHHFIKILDNLKKITPCALNIGIKNAKGEIIIRMDAHAIYIKDYISKCVKYLLKYEADNVGGIWKIMPQKNTLINKAIVIVSSSFLGGGNAYYRLGYNKGSKSVDTVHGGCYRKEIFQKIGLFNENLKRSQDMEFNIRLKKAGGKIMLFPDIITYYYPKSTLKEFLKHNFQDGIWSVYPLKFGIKLKLRHFMPLIFVLGLIVFSLLSFWLPGFVFVLSLSVLFYFLVLLVFSFVYTLREKNIKIFPLLIITFIVRHFGYGLGSLWGLIKILVKK